MTPREISRAIHDLDRQEREEIEVFARPVRDKYWTLKQEVKDQCKHNYILDPTAGVLPWDEHWYCAYCNKREYRCNDDIKAAYVKSNPEFFEDEGDE